MCYRALEVYRVNKHTFVSLWAIFIGFILLEAVFFLPVVQSEDTTDDLVFIHHSCGSNWLNDGLHDALIAKDYIDERNDITYNTDLLSDAGRPDSLGPTPGDNTNMNHWILWFNDYLENVKQHDCVDGFNKIIMFKSCYPTSNIVSDGTEPGDPFSSTQTIANYKAVYRKYNGGTYTHNGYTYYPLEDIFAANPDILFIPVTAPPRHYAPSDATNDAEAHRAYVFNNWLKNDWLSDYNTNNPGLDNVAVYDWFDFLSYADDHTTHPNRLKSEYGGESGNSHPNTLANQESTQDYATNSPNFIDTAWNTFENTNPATWNVSVYPENQNVALNSYVEIDIIANHSGTANPVTGWEIELLNFSADKLYLNSVTEGEWLSSVGTTMFSEGTIDNTAGNVTDIYCFTLGENTTNDGVLCTLNFSSINTGVASIDYAASLSFEGNLVEADYSFGSITINDDVSPGIEDNSPDSGTTGDSFVFNVSVIDDHDAAENLNVYVNWSHEYNSGNNTMTHVGNNYFTYETTLDQSVSDISYSYWVEDSHQNTNVSTVYTANVIDNDAPMLVSDNSPSGTTGDSYQFSADFTDNIQSESALTVYVDWMHDTSSSNDSMTYSDGSWITSITLDESTNELTYSYWVQDSAGNILFNSGNSPVSVFDNDPPVFVDDDSDTAGTTGDMFHFSINLTDNIDSESELTVFVDWEHGSIGDNESMVYSDNNWIKTINLQSNSVDDLVYEFFVKDQGGNILLATGDSPVEVTDNDKPCVDTPACIHPFPDETGVFHVDWVNISSFCSDNIAIELVNLNLTYPDSSSEHINITSNKTSDSYWSKKTFGVIGDYAAHMWVRDSAGNSNQSSSRSFTVFYSWDQNQDNSVSIDDITSITGHYGETGENRWIKQDVCVDGDINIHDITLITAHYNEQY